MAPRGLILAYFRRLGWKDGSKLLFVLGVFFMAIWPTYATTIYENRDIPLIDNRFRVDFGIERATFLLYREMGSPAAILVRPDGSKIYAWSLPDNVQWLESDELDIVTIDSPMAGPWQAIAENRGRNRIRVLSDLVLRVDDIPRKLYEGEWIGLTADLTNRGEKLELGVYLSDALLELSLISSHRAEDDNYALKNTMLGKFLDNGELLDEVPEDGIFTCQLLLDVPAGQYNFVAKTKNEVFTRAHQQSVLVYPPPYIALLMPPKADKSAELIVKVDTTEIEANSLIIDGFIEGNLGWREPFQVRMETDEQRITLPTPTQSGHYRLQGDAFATTVNGREIHLKLPSKSFVVIEPVEPIFIVPSEEVNVEPESTSSWGVIVLVVVALLLVGGGGFAIVVWRKRRAFAKALEAANADDALSVGESAQSAEELPMEEPDLNESKD